MGQMRERREQGFTVFDMNGCDLVAAHDPDEAVDFYMAVEGVPRDKIHTVPIELELDEPFPYVDTPESEVRTVTHRQLIQEALKELELPCILVSFITVN